MLDRGRYLQLTHELSIWETLERLLIDRVDGARMLVAEQLERLRSQIEAERRKVAGQARFLLDLVCENDTLLGQLRSLVADPRSAESPGRSGHVGGEESRPP